MPRVAHYAEGECEYIHLDKDPLDRFHAAMLEKKATYLVIQEREVAAVSKAAEPVRKSLTEVMRYGKKGMETVIIYKITP